MNKYNQGRELKFRVWDEKYNCWDNQSIELIPNTLLLKQGRIIQQYTGCHDKNKKEIYEGDIISYSFNDSEPPMIGVVEFFAGMFIVSWNDQTDDELAYMRIDGMEVVGNIFETPELIK